MCTYLNKPTRPGCELCATERPQDYTVPSFYLPDQQELYRIQQEELATLQYIQVKRTHNFSLITFFKGQQNYFFSSFMRMKHLTINAVCVKNTREENVRKYVQTYSSVLNALGSCKSDKS